MAKFSDKDIFQNFEKINYDSMLISNVFKNSDNFPGLDDGTIPTLDYNLTSNEDVTVIADKILGNSLFVWAIYNMNNILHPVYSFPIKDYTFKAWILDKFDGITIYIDPTLNLRNIELSLTFSYSSSCLARLVSHSPHHCITFFPLYNLFCSNAFFIKSHSADINSFSTGR